jgi:hypothetical protein
MSKSVMQKYAKVTTGLAFEVLEKFKKSDEDFWAKIRAICEELHAKPNCCSSIGWAVTGLKPLGAVPKGWRMSKQSPGFMIPDKTKKAGKEWAEKLKLLKLPQTEDLAHDLGFPPFFHSFAGHFCTNVGYRFVDGAYLIAYPCVLDFNHPHQPITFEEYNG